MPLKALEIKLEDTLRETVAECLQRFWNHVKIMPRADDCWEWNTQGKARPQFSYKGKMVQAARFSYLIVRGDPGSSNVLHTCDNGQCVNPSHLFLGTHLDNMRDRNRKGRARGGQANAILTEEKVREMRKLHIPHVVSYRMLGEMFGVSTCNAMKVVRRIYWKNVI